MFAFMDTKTQFMGLDLDSPVIAGGCGLTADVANLRRLEEMGAGAVVLEPVMEEEIMCDIRRNTRRPSLSYGDSFEYACRYVEEDRLSRFFDLVREAKRCLRIPVIGSINCFSYDNWLTYARRFEEAGCDALELNMELYPLEVTLSTDDVERAFTNVIQSLKKSVTIPIGVKISPYFTDLAKTAQQLSWMGLGAVSIFNKPMLFDVNIDEEKMVNSEMVNGEVVNGELTNHCASHNSQFTIHNSQKYYEEGELYNVLGWTAVLSKKMRCDLSATTGVRDAEDVVKLLLAGAKTVQVSSCLYRNGIDYMGRLNEGLREWMAKRGYEHIDDFRGKLALKSNDNVSMMLRTETLKMLRVKSKTMDESVNKV